MVKKRGISLVVLVITIIVILILISISVVLVGDTVGNANISSFANSLKQVEDATESYYITNKELPTLETDDKAYTQAEILQISGSSNQTLLSNEIELNKDQTAEAYYKISLNKINVKSSRIGNNSEGENDIFVVAIPSMNVYYLKGVEANDEKYFSLSSKIGGIVKINKENEPIDNSTTKVLFESGGIKVLADQGFTNKLEMNITTNLEADETLHLLVDGISQKQLLTQTGVYNRTFNFSDLFVDNDILASNAKYGTQDFNFMNPSIEIIKKKAGTEVARVKIDRSKYDIWAPTLNNISTQSYSKMNTITLEIADVLESGIWQVKYDYLTKLDENSVEQNYYEGVSSFDIEYMKKQAKTYKNGQLGKISINVPKAVNQISVAVFDNAGNYVLQGIRVSPMINISVIEQAPSQTEAFSIKSNIYSTKGISKIRYTYSIDGINYSNEVLKNLNTNTQIVTEQVEYTSLSQENIFLKIEATDNNSTVANRKTETKIIKLTKKAMQELDINAPALVQGMTPIKWDAAGNVITTNTADPQWYNYQNKQWANVQTADGSFWVWIPRYEYQITNPHTSTAQEIKVNFIKGTKKTSTSGYIMHPAFTFGSDELTGIWVAKFEATAREGVENATTGDNVTTKNVKILPNVSSWRYISISNMFDVAKKMETDATYGWGTSGSGIDTHLMKNVEWGAVAYLSNSKYGKNAEVWINPYREGSSPYDYKTGQAGDSVSASYTTTTNAYTTTNGMQASTTGNITGVYDMSGGANEHTAAYVNNGNSNLTTYGASILSAENKYKDVYQMGNSDTGALNYEANKTKVGDAVYETSSQGTGSNSWYSDYSYMPYSSNPFFIRGGVAYSGASAGMFCFNVNTGLAYSPYGFRPVLGVSGVL